MSLKSIIFCKLNNKKNKQQKTFPIFSNKGLCLSPDEPSSDKESVLYFFIASSASQRAGAKRHSSTSTSLWCHQGHQVCHISDNTSQPGVASFPWDQLYLTLFLSLQVY